MTNRGGVNTYQIIRSVYLTVIGAGALYKWKFQIRRPYCRQRIRAGVGLNKRTNVGRVTKILKKMEGATQSVCPGQAICGDHGRLAAEDRQKASAFVRTYASVSRQVRSKKEDRRTKAGLKTFKTSPCHCGGDRADACQAFSAQELENQIRQMKTRKAPGPDGICGEHLQHLGPIAKASLLDLINHSWLRAEVPTAWRRARIIPILKSGRTRNSPAATAPSLSPATWPSSWSEWWGPD